MSIHFVRVTGATELGPEVQPISRCRRSKRLRLTFMPWSRSITVTSRRARVEEKRFPRSGQAAGGGVHRRGDFELTKPQARLTVLSICPLLPSRRQQICIGMTGTIHSFVSGKTMPCSASHDHFGKSATPPTRVARGSFPYPDSDLFRPLSSQQSKPDPMRPSPRIHQSGNIGPTAGDCRINESQTHGAYI
jgi:hypothetical protein